MLMERAAIRRCKYPVACSSSLAEFYSGRYGLSMHAIRNGVSGFCCPGTISEKPLMKAMMVGSLCERKDPITALKAFRCLPEDLCSFHVCGKGELYEVCRLYESDNVVFHGYVDNIREHMVDADVLVSSSTSEGLPMSVLEAGATGCYLVLSDIPAHRELLKENKQCGILFPVGDDRALAEAVQGIDLPKLRASRKARSLAFLQNHSSARMAKEYELLYENMR